MTVEEISNQIRSYEQQYRVERRELQKEIDELEELHIKFNSLQGRFADKQQRRQSALQRLTGCHIRNQIIGKYFNGMGQLLSGREFNSAYSGLCHSIFPVYAGDINKFWR